MTLEEARDLVTDEMLDAAQVSVDDVFRIDADLIIAAALQVMFNSDD